jgi:redox-sensitive bicupin YhaK (pirin superfamily)
VSNFAKIDLLIQAQPKNLGDFTVRRSLPYKTKRMVGPFIFFDHMGPVELAIHHGMDVRPHPHIGLSTLTYLFEGEIIHKDTLGVDQAIRPGAVNWMTAGSGVAHSERSSQLARQKPQNVHGLQIWIALPKEKEEISATFHHHEEKSIPVIREQESTVKVIAGGYNKEISPVGIHSDLIYLNISLYKGKIFLFPSNTMELAVYVVDGNIEIGDQVLPAGSMAVVEMNKDIKIHPLTDASIMILGGKPFEEPRHIWWNFVSSSKERIERAKQDWKNNLFGSIKGEVEFIPLPEN